MKENPLENSSKQNLETKKLIDELLLSFNGAQITNSEGKIITLNSKFERIIKDVIATKNLMTELYVIEFEGYPGVKDAEYNPKENGHDLNANYISIEGDPANKRIIIEYALLNHPDLIHKEVYSKFISLLLEKLAQKPFAGFKVFREIAHTQRFKRLKKILSKYKTSKTPLDEMKKTILNDSSFRSFIPGHNKFYLNFDRIDNRIEVTSELDSKLKEPNIEITINGLPIQV